MFTGIIQHMGRIAQIKPAEGGRSLLIDSSGWTHRPNEGESIAVNGCCLTLAPNPPESKANTLNLRFDVIHQTLRLTTLGELAVGDAVNLEHAATPTTLLGGHIVQGHVDGVGVVLDVDRGGGEWRVRIESSDALTELMVAQGSICIDGVSLTVADLGQNWFDVALIPMTLRLTNLSRLVSGSRVNLEVDCIAKIVVSWLKRKGSLRI